MKTRGPLLLSGEHQMTSFPSRRGGSCRDNGCVDDIGDQKTVASVGPLGSYNAVEATNALSSWFLLVVSRTDAALNCVCVSNYIG